MKFALLADFGAAELAVPSQCCGHSQSLSQTSGSVKLDGLANRHHLSPACHG
jgi:hypothetical protein